VLTDGARRRRLARRAVLALVACCVLAGTVPAAIELSRQGLDSWTSVEPFLEHRSFVGMWTLSVYAGSRVSGAS
jgi:hypothetical protein